MSELDRIIQAAKAYGNRGIEEIERLFGRDPEAEAHRELDEALNQPIPTTGGQVLKGPDKSESTASSSKPGQTEDHKFLGVAAGATKAEVKLAYETKDKRIAKLIQQIRKHLRESKNPDNESALKAAKVEAAELRKALKRAYLRLIEEGDAIVGRFRSLEIDDGPEKPNPKSPEPKDQATTRRFRNLDLGDA